MSNEVKVGAHIYKIGRLNAFDQYDVARKMASVLFWLGSIKKDTEKPDATPSTAEDFAKAICAMTGQISSADSDFAMGKCLAVISRKQAGGVGWAAISTGGRVLMFDDIELQQMLELVWHVLESHRLPSFFDVAPAGSGEPAQG